jgi:glyceraldehyde-3-phosphate dehydrogenase/erythrose-4-phosphate dehydrogenase
MTKKRIAINGFGRIGRLVYRQIYNMEGIDVVAELMILPTRKYWHICLNMIPLRADSMKM